MTNIPNLTCDHLEKYPNWDSTMFNFGDEKVVALCADCIRVVAAMYIEKLIGVSVRVAAKEHANWLSRFK